MACLLCFNLTNTNAYLFINLNFLGRIKHARSELIDREAEVVPGPVLLPQGEQTTTAITFGTLFLGANTVSGGLDYIF